MGNLHTFSTKYVNVGLSFKKSNQIQVDKPIMTKKTFSLYSAATKKYMFIPPNQLTLWTEGLLRLTQLKVSLLSWLTLFLWGKIYGWYKSSRLAVAILEVGGRFGDKFGTINKGKFWGNFHRFSCKLTFKKLKKAISKSFKLRGFFGHLPFSTRCD